MRSRRAFSLVELLTTLAVLAILAGLILSAFQGARHSARAVQCRSDLRQLGIAAQLYWGDSAGRLFPYLLGRTDGGRIYWFGWLESGAEGRRRFRPEPGPLWPHLQGRGVELCPSFDYRHPRYKPKAEGASWGYGYNRHLSPGGLRAPLPEDPVRRVSDLRRPSGLVLLADAAQINDFQAPASRDNPLVEEFYYVDDGGPSYANGHFRHRERGMAVFVDGHTEAVARAPGSLDPRLPRLSVARYPAGILVP